MFSHYCRSAVFYNQSGSDYLKKLIQSEVYVFLNGSQVFDHLWNIPLPRSPALICMLCVCWCMNIEKNMTCACSVFDEALAMVMRRETHAGKRHVQNYCISTSASPSKACTHTHTHTDVELADQSEAEMYLPRSLLKVCNTVQLIAQFSILRGKLSVKGEYHYFSNILFHLVVENVFLISLQRK